MPFLEIFEFLEILESWKHKGALFANSGILCDKAFLFGNFAKLAKGSAHFSHRSLPRVQ